jgi:hypothetical protein
MTQGHPSQEAKRFDEALDRVLSVSHNELKRRESEWKKQKAAKRIAKEDIRSRSYDRSKD